MLFFAEIVFFSSERGVFFSCFLLLKPTGRTAFIKLKSFCWNTCFYKVLGGFHGWNPPDFTGEIRWISKDQLPGMVSPMFFGLWIPLYVCLSQRLSNHVHCRSPMMWERLHPCSYGPQENFRSDRRYLETKGLIGSNLSKYWVFINVFKGWWPEFANVLNLITQQVCYF